MNKFIAALIGNGLIFLTSAIAQAGNAQWDLNPASGDWNTAANWTPMTVPNASTDTATFGLSNTPTIGISANTQVNGIKFTPGASAYDITPGPGVTLTFTGTGITNQSGPGPLFEPSGRELAPAGIVFSNSSTAANAGFIIGGSAFTRFQDSSTAGNAGFTISNANGDFGVLNFQGSSTAGNAGIENQGFVGFSDRSSAGSATIGNQPFGAVSFSDRSSAGTATILFTFATSISFSGSSSAGSATMLLSEESHCVFSGNSTAGSANINVGLGELDFLNSSTGGTAQITVNQFFPARSTGIFDISGHNAPSVTIGSLESAGNDGGLVLLGKNNLTVGSNNLSTTFSGTIKGGGSLTKIGTGRLTLNGANTYTGNTNINGGVLMIDGSITSNTLVNSGGKLAGTGTIQGNVTNEGTVSPGDAPGTLTVNNYTQRPGGALLIDIAGAKAGQFSVLNVLGTANLGGLLDPVLLNGFVPIIGESFAFLDYGAVTGSLFIFDRNIDNVAEHWDVTYQAKDAILTVAPGNVPVADWGSTFLLLTLSLLGLVTFQRRLLHKRA